MCGPSERGGERTMERDDLRSVEAAIAAAWPADETRAIGGWLWRASGGGYGRANSVATLGCPGDVEAAIDEVEALYQARSAPVLIQVTDASEPADLSQRLASRGYRVGDENATMVLDLGGAVPRPVVENSAFEIETTAEATADWIETYATVLDTSRRASAPRILARVPRPCHMIGVRRDGRHIATVLLIVSGPIAVVECVATRSEARRSGAGRVGMEVAIETARRAGARRVALSMVANNGPARRLYEALGFVEVGRNRYLRNEG